MKQLQELLYQVPLLEVRGELNRMVVDFTADSRQAQTGWLFAAVRGTQTDGHLYIEQALNGGATVVVCEQMPINLDDAVTYVRVSNSAEALAYIAANFYDNPSRQLTIVGTTGTNGKTTVTTLLYELFTKLGYTCGLVSTVVIKIGNEEYPARLTTPDAKELQQLFRKMVDAGCTHAFMECSSIALHQHRCTGVQYTGGIFTNLTHDHLDYHGTFANYLAAKQILFDRLLTGSAFALTNADDRNGRIMVQNTRARVKTYALQTVADYKCRLLENQLEGLLLDVEGRNVWFRLTGEFNAYNLLAVISAARELGQELEAILLKASELGSVNGRFQILRFEGPVTAIVDYAHTPDALKNVLETARTLAQHGGRLVTIVGCGGNRDKAKRPLMARIACELSDRVILTSDNPRNEDPNTILDEMEAGVPVGGKRRVLRIVDRHEAILTAARTAVPNDLIVIAGKGHETYQEIAGVRHHFDDREEISRAFNA
jgi:UDP-N-acetylmuramoyl-L-alanyl-D-glutamate--2,6-diaminopimelate ligase